MKKAYENGIPVVIIDSMLFDAGKDYYQVFLPHRDVVLWEKHGALATGEDVEKAFDYLDVANKGAKMYLMAKAAGFEPAGLSDSQIKGLDIFV